MYYIFSIYYAEKAENLLKFLDKMPLGFILKIFLNKAIFTRPARDLLIIWLYFTLVLILVFIINFFIGLLMCI